MIIGEIRRYLRDNNAIRVSRSLRDLAYKALQLTTQLTNERGVEPQLQEVADILGSSVAAIRQAYEAIQDPVSLYEPVFHDGGDALFVMDQLGDSSEGEPLWLDALALREGMRRLNERERHILDLRFFVGRTQMEVAQEIGISQAQVSRLEKTALKHMRKHL